MRHFRKGFLYGLGFMVVWAAYNLIVGAVGIAVSGWMTALMMGFGR